MTLYALWQINSYTVTFDANYLPGNLYTNPTPALGVNAMSSYTRAVIQDEEASYGEYLQYTVNENGRSGTGFFSRFGYNVALEIGQKYTYTVEVKCSSEHNILIGHEQGGTKKVYITNEWQKISHTFTATSTGYTAFVFYVSGESWNTGDVFSIRSPQLAKIGSINATSVQKTYTSTLGTLSTPTREGYTFDGWYTAPSGGTKISSSTTVPARNVTYYAHWKINNYTVTFDKNYLENNVWNNSSLPNGMGYEYVTISQEKLYDDNAIGGIVGKATIQGTYRRYMALWLWKQFDKWKNVHLECIYESKI